MPQQEQQQQEQAAAEAYIAIEAALRAAAEYSAVNGERAGKAAIDGDIDGDEKPIVLTAVFSAWRCGVKALLGDMAGLAAAEGKLAAVGAAQFLVGGLVLLSLATLALVCLEVALALALYAFALPPLVIALLLCGVNLLLAFVIVQRLKPLTANFSFEHTRQMLSKSEDTSKATAEAAQQAAAAADAGG